MFSAFLAKLGIKGFATQGGESSADKIVVFNSDGELDQSVVQPNLIDHNDLMNVGTRTHLQIDSHISNTNNPHNVTKAQVGLGNVNNTSDANKPISTATQAAFDDKTDLSAFNSHANDESIHLNDAQDTLLDNITATYTELNYSVGVTSGIQAQLNTKATTSALTTHTTNTSNPHSVTKTQVGLGNADNTSDANKPVSTAAQTALDLKATVVDLTTHTSNTSNPHSVTKTQVGLGNCDNTSDANKPISTATQTALDLKATVSALTTHTTNTSNPHSVTKAQVGLGNADNTSDANKPISTATQTALDLKADDTSLTTHTADNNNPHSVTKSQVGLGNCDNTSDANKPISTATQTALDLKADITSVVDVQDALDTHTSNTSNPHSVTKSQVGLGNCDNTSDANKPVSTATQTALDLKANDSALTTHIADASKHLTTGQNSLLDALTASATELNYSVGVTSAIQTQLDTKAPLADPTFTGTPRVPDRVAVNNSTAAANTRYVDNAISTAKTDIANRNINTSGLASGGGNLTADRTINVPVASQAEAEAGIATTVAMNPLRTAQAIAVHTSNTSNPHSVTKAQVGLGNADNTSDANKPISTATQTALDLKATGTDLSTHIADATKHLSAGQNTLLDNLNATYTELNYVAGTTSNIQDQLSDISSDIATNSGAIDTVSSDLNTHIDDATKHLTSTQNTFLDAVTVTAAEVNSLSGVSGNIQGQFSNIGLDITSNADNIASVSSSIDTHSARSDNPHFVTKTQVGLGNCDDTSDADKPISTAVQDALDLKGGVISTPLIGHVETDGNDTTGDGSLNAPFATLDKAVTEGFTTIELGVGTFPQTLQIDAGSGINISGKGSNRTFVTGDWGGFLVGNGTPVNLNGLGFDGLSARGVLAVINCNDVVSTSAVLGRYLYTSGATTMTSLQLNGGLTVTSGGISALGTGSGDNGSVGGGSITVGAGVKVTGDIVASAAGAAGDSPNTSSGNIELKDGCVVIGHLYAQGGSGTESVAGGSGGTITVSEGAWWTGTHYESGGNDGGAGAGGAGSLISGFGAWSSTINNKLSAAIYTHATDFTVHLTNEQNTLLDGITVTANDINYLTGITSNVQDQFNAIATKADDSEAIAGTDDAKFVTPKGVALSKAVIPVNTITTSSYILQLTDMGVLSTVDFGTDDVVAVPPNGDVAFPIGAQVLLTQLNTGKVTISPGSGVTLVSSTGTYQTSGQYALCSLTKIATDTWLIGGSLIAA